MLEADRRPWADMARGFSIVTVVFFHVALSLDTVGTVDWKVWLLINLFAPIPIALFFFVSGLFTRRVVEGGWSAGLGRRLVGLLYAFVVWSLIEAIVQIALAGRIHRPDIWRYLLDPESTLWFVWALAIFTVGAHLFWTRWPRLSLGVSIIASALSFSGVIAIDSFVYQNVLRFFPFFLLGLAAPSLEALVARRRWLIASAGAATYTALTALAPYGGASGWSGTVLAAMTWISIPTSIAGCMMISRLPLFGQMIQWLGKNSLGIYLGHPVAIMLLVAASRLVWSPGDGPMLMPVFALTLPAVFASAALYWLAVRSRVTALYVPPFGSRPARGLKRSDQDTPAGLAPPV